MRPFQVQGSDYLKLGDPARMKSNFLLKKKTNFSCLKWKKKRGQNHSLQSEHVNLHPSVSDNNTLGVSFVNVVV